MQKVYLDNNNTIDSVVWTHKGYSVTLNRDPYAFENAGRIWVSRYNVYNPADELIAGAVNLACAKATIEEEIAA